ncbi:MAG: hypothetical protein Kow0069_36030 [Promethearchaeota archaeon]
MAVRGSTSWDVDGGIKPLPSGAKFLWGRFGGILVLFLVVATNASDPEGTDLLNEVRRRGHEGRFVSLRDCRVEVGGWDGQHDVRAGGGSLLGAAAAFVRGVGASEVGNARIFFRTACLRAMEEFGVKVVNSPGAIERATDKLLASIALARRGLPTPRTVVVEEFAEAKRAFHDLGGDVVLKPVFGSMGVGVTRLNDPGFAEYVFATLEQAREAFYLQEFVEHGNRDLRLFVVGGRVVASMARVTPADSPQPWKTNVHAGAQPRKYEPNDELRDLAAAAAEAVGLEVAGVDVLEAPDGTHQVVEVNSIPGWRALQRASGVDVPSLVVDHVLEALRR